MLKENSLLPVIAFSFSRRECEGNAMGLSNVDCNTDEEKATVEEVSHPPALCCVCVCVWTELRRGKQLFFCRITLSLQMVVFRLWSLGPFFRVCTHMRFYACWPT